MRTYIERACRAGASEGGDSEMVAIFEECLTDVELMQLFES